MDNESTPSDVVVIVAPFPCYSHLNQLLHLSCLISSYNIPIHYACSTTHINQVKLRFNSMKKLESSLISFHELHTPPFLSPPPNPNSTVKFPSHLQPAFDSSLHLREPLVQLFHKVSSTAKRVVVIHDVLMSYAVQDISPMPRVESYLFYPSSSFSSYWQGKQMSPNPSDKKNLPEGLPSMEGCYTPEVQQLGYLHITSLKSCVGTIINSSRSIESTYISLLEKEDEYTSRSLWAIGPLNMWTSKDSMKPNCQHTCLDWLDKQEPNSVIYVSFGTTVSLSDEQVTEIALGLEKSGQKFVWILRDADKGDIFEGEAKRVELPNGFEERTKAIGVVIRDWAPQLEILNHPSVGGFMNHCGWNSCLDGIATGVPMATWPMHSEQPLNAYQISEVLKVGLAVIKWENRNELVSSSTISQVVKRLMASKDGEETRKRVKDLCKAAQEAVEEGGVSHLELDSFVAHIKRDSKKMSHCELYVCNMSSKDTKPLITESEITISTHQEIGTLH